MVAYSEKDWQAESDARTLAEAERIKSDPRRMSAAKSKIDVQVRNWRRKNRLSSK